MPTQLRLPVQPAGADEINDVVAVLRRDGQVAYFAAGVPLFTHREDDAVGQRIAAVQMLELGLARLRLRPTRHVAYVDRWRWRDGIDYAVGGQGTHLISGWRPRD